MIVPAFNEAETIGDTILSLQKQTSPPQRIIVVDDCSSDGTGEVASSYGVDVLRPDHNTGSKAAAQTFALNVVTSPFTLAIDADTILDADAIARLRIVFLDDDVAAASGFVLPRYVKTPWERGRYVEYLYGFTFHKPIQDFYRKPLISSGCFSMYRTDVLREAGGWSDRTMAEDMDLTWTFYQRGWQVRFEPEAVSYPIEPSNMTFLAKQLRRWSHGFVQNVVLHWRGVLGLRYLRSTIAIGFFDAIVASIVTLFLIPALAIAFSPWFLLFYIVDLPVVAIPVVVGGWRRGETLLALTSLPSYFLLRLVNSWFMLGAVVSELVLGRRLDSYEKGH